MQITTASLSSDMRRLSHAVLIVAILPCLLSFVIYYGFFTAYVGEAFHREAFRAHYESGVYRYRVLGRELLLATHSVVVSQTKVGQLARRILPEAPRGMALADAKGDGWFYGSFFILNTAFLVGASLLLYAICFRGGLGAQDRALAAGKYSMGLLIMTLTQFVPTAYDMLSCFFLLAAAYLIVRPMRWGFAGVLLCVGLGALTRESAAMILALYLAYHVGDLMRLNREAIWRLTTMIALFAVVYVALRLYYGTEHAVCQMVRWRLNVMDQKSLFGLLLLPALCGLIMAGVARPMRCWVFLAACAPYALAMLTIANTWEVRLWVPVWLGLLVLAHVDTSEAGTEDRLAGTACPTGNCSGMR